MNEEESYDGARRVAV